MLCQASSNRWNFVDHRQIVSGSHWRVGQVWFFSQLMAASLKTSFICMSLKTYCDVAYVTSVSIGSCAFLGWGRKRGETEFPLSPLPSPLPRIFSLCPNFCAFTQRKTHKHKTPVKTLSTQANCDVYALGKLIWEWSYWGFVWKRFAKMLKIVEVSCDKRRQIKFFKPYCSWWQWELLSNHVLQIYLTDSLSTRS